MHELAANAVRHGAGHGQLRLWAGADALRCEVTDDGAAQSAEDVSAGAGDAAQWRIDPRSWAVAGPPGR